MAQENMNSNASKCYSFTKDKIKMLTTQEMPHALFPDFKMALFKKVVSPNLSSIQYYWGHKRIEMCLLGIKHNDFKYI